MDSGGPTKWAQDKQSQAGQPGGTATDIEKFASREGLAANQNATFTVDKLGTETFETFVEKEFAHKKAVELDEPAPNNPQISEFIPSKEVDKAK